MSEISLSKAAAKAALDVKHRVFSERGVAGLLLTAIAIGQSIWIAALGYGFWLLIAL